MKILLFGKNGQVGWELSRSLLALGEVIVCDRNQADFSNPESLRSVVSGICPDVIVNAAAYTAVDKAEDEKELAMTVNAVAPGVLAEEAARLNSLLVHYSTDYVFDGCKESVYLETDAPNPVNVYGKSKLEGERAIISAGCDYLILRTSWVYASRGRNFLKTVIRLAREKEKLQVVDDQFGVPTWARYIADSTSHIILKKLESKGRENEIGSGVFHLANHGVCTWHSFAEKIISRLRSHESIKLTEVVAIGSEQYNFVAERPKRTALCSDHVENVFALHNVDWQHALQLCMDEVLE